MPSHIIIPFFIPETACPYRCIYCNQSIITSQKKIKNEEVIESLNNFLFRLKIPKKKFEFSFFGGNFTGLDNKAIKELLDIITKKFENYKNFIGIRFSTHPKFIDKNTINVLKNYKINTVELGIQSFDERILNSLKRNYNLKTIIKSISLLKELKAKICAQLLLGCPSESCFTHILNTYYLKKYSIDYIRLYPLYVIKNTILEKMLKNKEFTPLNIEKITDILCFYIKFCKKFNIKIIRIGLKNDKKLEENIIAGPYHPSIGEIAYSKYFLKRIENIIISNNMVSGTFYINPKDTSKFLGYNKKNFKKILKKYKFKLKYVLKEEISKGEIVFRKD